MNIIKLFYKKDCAVSRILGRVPEFNIEVRGLLVCSVADPLMKEGFCIFLRNQIKKVENSIEIDPFVQLVYTDERRKLCLIIPSVSADDKIRFLEELDKMISFFSS